MNWTVIESAASALSAIVAGVMALMTYFAITQARIHHKDEYRPILVLASIGSACPFDRSQLLRIEEPQSPNSDCYYNLYALLNNIGCGPALNVKLTLRFMGIDGYGVRHELSPMASEEMVNFVDNPLRLRARIHEGFNDTDFKSSLNTSWEIFLDYEDIFGQSFRTIHSKDKRLPWSVFGLTVPKEAKTSWVWK
jgi:hypothetical protein